MDAQAIACASVLYAASCMVRYCFMVAACALFLVGCNSKVKNRKAGISEENSLNQLYEPTYARGFTLLADEDGKVLKVRNPWQGAEGVEFVYHLTPNPTSDNRSIKYPVEKVVCLSSTHVAFIDMVNQTEKIVGVSGITYITNPAVNERYAEGLIADVGYESGISYERLALLKPDVVFAYGIDGEIAGVETKLNEMGIKLVYIGEYMEQSPLGKAEWVVPMAMFFGVEQLAAERFRMVAEQYEALKEQVSGVASRPKVMLNAPYKGTWYIPGGASHIACLLKDAGADYLYADNDRVESSPVSLEAAFIKSQEADFWLTPNAAVSLKEISMQDSRLASIPAYKKGMVYNSNARMTIGGGSDFWESGVVNPHIILKDLVKIFHPNLLPPTYTLYYFRQLK